MAGPKITISLTPSEAAHVREALRLANQIHEEDLGRPNPALTRALAKVDEARKPKPAEEAEPE